MRYLASFILSALVLIGCDSKSAPPISLGVIAPAVTKQLNDRFGDHDFKVENPRYDASKHVYYAEVNYKFEGQAQRYVMSLLPSFDSNRQFLTYRGEFPTDLLGEDDLRGRVVWPVTIDEMMKE